MNRKPEHAALARGKPGRPRDPVDAATVILVRDGPDGLEALMLRRSSKLDFAGGMWVFPGGRVDPVDREGLEADDLLGASRRAAVREAREEAGVVLDESSLIPFSHWTPPAIAPRRFLTWFFISPAPGGAVTVDQGEIKAHAWMRPGEAMQRRNALEIELAAPTWVTLARLATFPDVETALARSRASEPERFATRIALVEGGAVALYHGDAGYQAGDAGLLGGRHRLWMLSSGWRYERSTP